MQTTLTVTLTIFLLVLTPLTKRITSLGALLIFTAILTTITIRQTTNSWFAFILFLLYITGLLVLFRYIIAMSPNTYYTQKKEIKTTALICLLTTVTLTLFGRPTFLLNPMKGEKTFERDVTQLYRAVNMPTYWLIGALLLVALIIAVILCYKSAKPLRSYV